MIIIINRFLGVPGMGYSLVIRVGYWLGSVVWNMKRDRGKPYLDGIFWDG